MPSTLALIFLDPAAGVVVAAGGGIGLLFFYFLRLRRRPVRISSTLLWLQSTADLQVNVPFKWLRPSWLLLLQVLILGCLAAALGRPAFTGSDTRGRRVILLVDRSASMAARRSGASEDEASRFDRAKEAARRVLSALPAESRAMVAGFAAEASALTNFTRDRGRLRQAVEGIAQTDEPANLDRCFELVRALAGQVTEGAPDVPPRVVLITDGGFDAGAGEGGVGRATLDIVRVGAGPGSGGGLPDNVGIVAVAARRDYTDPSMVRLFVRVQSVTGRELSIPIEVRSRGEAIDATTLSITPGSVDRPAEAARTFEFQSTSGGVVTVTLGRTDDLASDNTAGLVLHAPQALSVLLVRPNIAIDAVDEVVRAALESLGPASLRVVNAAEYEQAASRDSADLVIFDRVRPATLPAAPSISFGATIPVPGLGVAEASADTPVAPTVFVYWVRSHPLMRYVVLNEVWVAKPLLMTLPVEDVGDASVRVESLAAGSAGPLIVLAELGGVRRVVVGFDIGQSNWVKDASFHIFLKNAVDYLTLSGEEEAGRAVRTTDTFSVRPAPGSKAVSVSGPVEFSREVSSPGERITIGPLSRVGIYEIEGVVEPDAVAAANLLDSTESRIDSPDPIQLATGPVTATTAADAAPKEVWHWFALAAIAALCIEWMVYAWRMRV